MSLIFLILLKFRQEIPLFIDFFCQIVRYDGVGENYVEIFHAFILLFSLFLSFFFFSLMHTQRERARNSYMHLSTPCYFKNCK